MRIPGSQRRPRQLAGIAAILAFGLLAAGCGAKDDVQNATGDTGGPNLIGFSDGQLGFPHQVVTTQGHEAAGLYLPVFIIAAVIFVLVEGLLLFAALRFRRKPSDTDLPPQTHGNNRLEFVWTAIPALIVLGMFVASTIVLTRVDAKSDDPGVVIDVQAFRFGWKFDYPDSGVSVAGGGREGAPEMVVPVDEPIRFRVTAVDVIHSFYVPSFFFKRDAIPGRVNEFEITVEEPGVYGGQCAEFCGLAHSEMYFSVRAVERSEFEAWLAQQPPAGAPPPAESAAPPPDDGAGPAEPPPATDQAAPAEAASPEAASAEAAPADAASPEAAPAEAASPEAAPADAPAAEASAPPGEAGAVEPPEAADQAAPAADQAGPDGAVSFDDDDSSPAEEPAASAVAAPDAPSQEEAY